MKKDREIDLSVKIEINYTCILYHICIGNIPS